jgi:hypothetical protein
LTCAAISRHAQGSDQMAKYTVQNREAIKLTEGETIEKCTIVGFRDVPGKGGKRSWLMDIDVVDDQTGEIIPKALWLTTALVTARESIMEDWEGKLVTITCEKRTGKATDPVEWDISAAKK